MAVKQGMLNGDEHEDREMKSKRENVLESGFIAPDGGWGWMIIVACGLSNFCLLAILQSFGLIFRERFQQLGINAAQTTTILNVNWSVMSCIGLANGPLFRKYSFRQVSFVGAFIASISIAALSFVRTFYGVFIFFSILYAIGNSVSMSACSLALNTYFKKKRSIAIGLSWTCTGLGAIIGPQIIAVLMPIYGVPGTVLLFGGFAFHAIACALLLQPVSRHAQKETDIQGIEAALSLKNIEFTQSPTVYMALATMEDNPKEDKKNNGILNDSDNTTEHLLPISAVNHKQVEEKERIDKSWYNRVFDAIVVFFDLDLLCDPIYVMLMLGMTCANFADINSIFLAPFILSEYGLSKIEVAFVISCQAGIDVLTRAIVPFIATLIRWDNKTFFLIGISSTSLGRVVLAHSRTRSAIVGVAVLMGTGKGLRLIFGALVLPTYVPLDRLPAASGIYLMMQGLLFLMFSSAVGKIRDISGNFTIVLHCLNVFAYLPIITWTLHMCFDKFRKKKQIGKENDERV